MALKSRDISSRTEATAGDSDSTLIGESCQDCSYYGTSVTSSTPYRAMLPPPYASFPLFSSLKENRPRNLLVIRHILVFNKLASLIPYRPLSRYLQVFNFKYSAGLCLILILSFRLPLLGISRFLIFGLCFLLPSVGLPSASCFLSGLTQVLLPPLVQSGWFPPFGSVKRSVVFFPSVG